MSVSMDIEEFGALTAGAGPQSEHVARSVETDADRRWGSLPLAGQDRPVRDLPVSGHGPASHPRLVKERP